MIYFNSLLHRISHDVNHGRMKQAKKHFDLAWSMYAKHGVTDEQENCLFALRGNFYAQSGGAMVCTEYGDYYEGLCISDYEV